MDENELRKLYLEQNLSQRDIEKTKGISRSKIRGLLYKYKIFKEKEKIIASMKGTLFEKGSKANLGRIRHDLRGRDWGKQSERTREKHPRWRGGIQTYRKIASAQKCNRCSTTKFHYDCGRIGIEIHHINGNRYDNRLENLETLCVPCHRREHLAK